MVINVGDLCIQEAVDILFVFTILFLFVYFPRMSKALGISQQTQRLSFKETTKFGGSS